MEFVWNERNIQHILEHGVSTRDQRAGTRAPALQPGFLGLSQRGKAARNRSRNRPWGGRVDRPGGRDCLSCNFFDSTNAVNKWTYTKKVPAQELELQLPFGVQLGCPQQES